MASDRNNTLKQAREAFRESGYRCIASHTLRGGEEGTTKIGELWMYSNGHEMCILQGQWEGTEWVGWDVFVPLTESNKVEDTLAAIRARAVKEVA